MATVWGMKKWPWWMFLAGTVCGAAIALLAVRGPEIRATPALQEAVAWQGWVGGAIGAASATAVALIVMRRSIRADQERFKQQRKDSQEHLDRQLAAAQEQATQALRQAVNEARKSARTARRLAHEQRRIEAWADLMAEIREFFWFSIDPDDLTTLEKRVTASFFRWTLYMRGRDQLVVDGVDVVMSSVIAGARDDARRQRGENAHARAGLRQMMIRCSSDDGIVDLVRYGSQLHRDGEAFEGAVAWFEARGSEKLTP
jgi:hypothetical protein